MLINTPNNKQSIYLVAAFIYSDRCPADRQCCSFSIINCSAAHHCWSSGRWNCLVGGEGAEAGIVQRLGHGEGLPLHTCILQRRGGGGAEQWVSVWSSGPTLVSWPRRPEGSSWDFSHPVYMWFVDWLCPSNLWSVSLPSPVVMNSGHEEDLQVQMADISFLCCMSRLSPSGTRWGPQDILREFVEVLLVPYQDALLIPPCWNIVEEILGQTQTTPERFPVAAGFWILQEELEDVGRKKAVWLTLFIVLPLWVQLALKVTKMWHTALCGFII